MEAAVYAALRERKDLDYHQQKQYGMSGQKLIIQG